MVASPYAVPEGALSPVVDGEDIERQLINLQNQMDDVIQLEFNSNERHIHGTRNCTETEVYIDSLQPIRPALIAELRRVAKFYADMAQHLEYHSKFDAEP